MSLRSEPFAEQDPNTGEYFPNIINPSDSAKKCYINEFNRIAGEIQRSDEMTELFLGKSQGMMGRIALVLHGLGSACGLNEITDELSEQTMLSAIEIMRYLVDQQMSVYNLAGKTYAKRRMDDIIGRIREHGGSIIARDLQRGNCKKWPTVGAAALDLKHLADAGYGEWNQHGKKFTLKESK